MAELTPDIIFDIETLRNQVAGLAEDMQMLSEIASQKIKSPYGDLTEIIKKNTEALEDNEKQLEDTQNAVDGVTKSSKSLSDKTKELTKAQEDLNKQIADFEKQGKDTAQLKKQLEIVEKGLKDVENQAKKSSSSLSDLGQKGIDALEGLLNKILPFNVSLSALPGAFTKIRVASTATFTSIKAGLISTGIGAFIVAIGSLVSFLTQTERGARLLRQALAGIGAAVNVLVDRFSKFGEGIVTLFTNPTKALELFRESFKGIGQELANEVALAARLSRILDEVAEAELNLSIQRGAANAKLKELNKTVEDTNKTNEERVQAAREFARIDQELTDRQVANQERRIAALLGFDEVNEEVLEKIRLIGEEGVNLSELGISESQISDLQEFANEFNNLSNLRAESIEKQTTNQNKLNILIKEGTDIELQAQRNSVAFFQQRISDLEKQADLLEIGSKAWKAISEQINNAKQELDDLLDAQLGVEENSEVFFQNLLSDLNEQISLLEIGSDKWLDLNNQIKEAEKQLDRFRTSVTEIPEAIEPPELDINPLSDVLDEENQALEDAAAERNRINKEQTEKEQEEFERRDKQRAEDERKQRERRERLNANLVSSFDQTLNNVANVFDLGSEQISGAVSLFTDILADAGEGEFFSDENIAQRIQQFGSVLQLGLSAITAGINRDIDETIARNQRLIQETEAEITRLQGEIEEQRELDEEGSANQLKLLENLIEKEKEANDERLAENERLAREQAELKKRAALLDIAVNTASGISAAVAAGAGLTFPANLPAILAGVAAVVAGIAQAKAALESVESFYEGTPYLDGPDHPSRRGKRDSIMLFGNRGERIVDTTTNTKEKDMLDLVQYGKGNPAAIVEDFFKRNGYKAPFIDHDNLPQPTGFPKRSFNDLDRVLEERERRKAEIYNGEVTKQNKELIRQNQEFNSRLKAIEKNTAKSYAPIEHVEIENGNVKVKKSLKRNVK